LVLTELNLQFAITDKAELQSGIIFFNLLLTIRSYCLDQNYNPVVTAGKNGCGSWWAMADDDIDEDQEEGEEGEEGEGKSSGGGSKKLIIIIAGVVLLLIGGGAAAFFMGLFDSLLGGDEAAVVAPAEDGKDVADNVAFFHELPEIVVNLNSKGRKRSVMKLKVSLEVASPGEIPKLEALMPRVLDNFQVYLRELRLDDLKGSAGMYRLREELLTRVNAAITPSKVRAVLFKEMLVQ